jgi:hypothetical protein
MLTDCGRERLQKGVALKIPADAKHGRADTGRSAFGRSVGYMTTTANRPTGYGSNRV